MIWGIAFILGGVILILFSKQLSKGHIFWQNSNYNFHFGKREIGIGKILNVGGGILFILVGILLMTGLLKTR